MCGTVDYIYGTVDYNVDTCMGLWTTMWIHVRDCGLQCGYMYGTVECWGEAPVACPPCEPHLVFRDVGGELLAQHASSDGSPAPGCVGKVVATCTTVQ